MCIFRSRDLKLRIEFGHRVTFAARAGDIGGGCFHLVTEFTFKIIIVPRSAGDPAHRVRRECLLDRRARKSGCIIGIPLTAVCVSSRETFFRRIECPKFVHEICLSIETLIFVSKNSCGIGLVVSDN